MRRMAIPMVLAAMLLAGCLVGETTHTVYVDPDGSLTWSVLEREIRSDSEDAAERAREEEGFIDQALRAEHPVARALDALGPGRLETRVLRSRRPFTVLTEARFGAIDRLAEEFLAGLAIPGEVRLEHGDSWTRLSLTLGPEPEDGSGDEADQTLLPLVGDPEDYRLILSRGRFLAAEGFVLSSDRTTATPERQEGPEAGEVLRLSLTWENSPG